MVPYNPNNLSTWFDPYNRDHINAYVFMTGNGYWPDWFQKIMKDNDIIINNYCEDLIKDKIAKTWINHIHCKE